MFKNDQKDKLTCLSNVLVILNAIGLIPTVIKHYKMEPIGLSLLYTDFTEVSKEYHSRNSKIVLIPRSLEYFTEILKKN